MTEISDYEAAEVLWASSEEGRTAYAAGYEQAVRMRLNIDRSDVYAIVLAAHRAIDRARAARPAETLPKVHDHMFDVMEAQEGTALRPGQRITVVLLRCGWCGLLSTASLEGAWTLEQLRKARA